ncbi:MAG: AAA family ATPase [Actinomycetota bacterium]|nr:AAA family ATPase [Actinomycetota bacterium]
MDDSPGGWLGDWPDLPPDSAYDNDPESTAAFDERTNSAPPPAPAAAAARPLDVRWVSDTFRAPPAKPDDLVHGLLRKGEFCGIASVRGIGKSLFAQNLALLLGWGDGMLGGTLKIARQANVLIAQGEVDEWESFARLTRMTAGHQPPAGVAETFDPWRIRVVNRRTSDTLRDEGGASSTSDEYIDAVLDPRLEQAIIDHNIDVLVVDPWAVFYGGRENSNDEVEAALGKLRELAMRHGLGIVIVLHVGKNTVVREPEDLWRGAGRLADWCSTRVTILPHYTEAEGARLQYTRQEARRFVDVKFLRRGEPTPDFSMVINHKTGWWEAWTPDAKSEEVAKPAAKARGSAALLQPADVADRCAEDGGWNSLRQAATRLGVSHGLAEKAIQGAVDAGYMLEVGGTRQGQRRFTLAGPRLVPDTDQSQEDE